MLGASATSTRSGARHPRGVTVFAKRSTKPARQGRKNGAATPRPPASIHSCGVHVRFPHPCAVTSLAAGVCCVHVCPARASAAPAPRRESQPRRDRRFALRVVERPRPRGVTVFADRSTKPARQGLKNGAATPHPPAHVGSCISSRSLHRPCAVTSLAAGVCRLHVRLARASAAPAPRFARQGR